MKNKIKELEGMLEQHASYRKMAAEKLVLGIHEAEFMIKLNEKISKIKPSNKITMIQILIDFHTENKDAFEYFLSPSFAEKNPSKISLQWSKEYIERNYWMPL